MSSSLVNAANVALSLGQADWHSHMHDGRRSVTGWGGTMFGGIGMLPFWDAMVVPLVLSARSFIGGSRTQSLPRSPHTGSTTRGILQERYAKGRSTRESTNSARKH